MKSYFAKLAARATLANAPISHAEPVRKTDPFEETTLIQPSPLAPARPVLSTEDPDRSVTSQTSPPAPLSLPGPSDTRDARTLKLRETLPPRPLVPSIERETATDLPQPVTAPRESVTQLIPEARPPLAPLPAAGDDQNTQQSNDASEDFAELQREQSLLLRKADDFMTRILRHRAEPVHRNEHDTELPPPPAKREPELERPARLVLAPLRPVVEPDSEPPALLIGTLTVEVMPPQPQPAASPSQVVVVRETRSPRTAVPSSRRFGLGQF